MKIGDEIRILEGWASGGHIVCLDPLTVLTNEGEEVRASLDNIEPYLPQKFVTSRGKHGNGRKQLSNEQEGY